MNKWLFYIGVALIAAFLIYNSLVGLTDGTRGSEDLRLSVEWITKFVLPWIFLYWFIKLVRKIK